MRDEDKPKSNAAKRADMLASAQASAQKDRPAQEQPAPAQRYPRSLGEFIAQNKVYILSVVAVVVLVTILIFALRSCATPLAG